MLQHATGDMMAQHRTSRQATGDTQMISSEPNAFGLLLRAYRDAAGKTIPALAAETGIDRGYIYRLEMQPHDWLNRPLESAPAKQPRRDLVIRLAFALHLTADQADELLLAAGYAPLFPIRTTTTSG